MWPFMKNLLEKGGKAMNKKTIIYTVETEVTFNDEGDWKRKVRQIRKDLKTVIGGHDGNRVTKIDSAVKG